MSRAFVRESDAPDELPERPQSPYPNYVTPRGLDALISRIHALSQQRAELAHSDDALARERIAEVDRDLRYFQGRVERAILVEPQGQPTDEVRFGATVDVEDEDGREMTFAIVGEDEADVAHGRISWAAPLGRALIGARLGDTVSWQRPAGDVRLVVAGIRY